MKIKVNFTSPVGLVVPFMIMASLSICVISIVIAVVMFVSASRLSTELGELEGRLERYRSHEHAAPANLPSLNELAQLRERIRNFNELTGTAKMTLPQLLTRIEKVIPDDVWLLDLQFRSRENEARMIIESKHDESLAKFMDKLEKSGNYSQVHLSRQSQREGKERLVQFEIKLNWLP